jgi:lipopolysaccharide export LptBFGC system permease protein LptF
MNNGNSNFNIENNLNNKRKLYNIVVANNNKNKRQKNFNIDSILRKLCLLFHNE